MVILFVSVVKGVFEFRGEYNIFIYYENDTRWLVGCFVFFILLLLFDFLFHLVCCSLL